MLRLLHQLLLLQLAAYAVSIVEAGPTRDSIRLGSDTTGAMNRNGGVMCWMDISRGVFPKSTAIQGSVKVGENLTMAIYIKDKKETTDLRVKDCYAYDSREEASRGGKPMVMLTSEQGCPLDKKVIDFWRTTTSTGSSGATVMAYTTISAFKFPGKENVFLSCNVELCTNGCMTYCKDEPLPLAPSNLTAASLVRSLSTSTMSPLSLLNEDSAEDEFDPDYDLVDRRKPRILFDAGDRDRELEEDDVDIFSDENTFGGNNNLELARLIFQEQVKDSNEDSGSSETDTISPPMKFQEIREDITTETPMSTTLKAGVEDADEDDVVTTNEPTTVPPTTTVQPTTNSPTTQTVTSEVTTMPPTTTATSKEEDEDSTTEVASNESTEEPSTPPSATTEFKLENLMDITTTTVPPITTTIEPDSEEDSDVSTRPFESEKISTTLSPLPSPTEHSTDPPSSEDESGEVTTTNGPLFLNAINEVTTVADVTTTQVPTTTMAPTTTNAPTTTPLVITLPPRSVVARIRDKINPNSNSKTSSRSRSRDRVRGTKGEPTSPKEPLIQSEPKQRVQEASGPVMEEEIQIVPLSMGFGMKGGVKGGVRDRGVDTSGVKVGRVRGELKKVPAFSPRAMVRRKSATNQSPTESDEGNNQRFRSLNDPRAGVRRIRKKNSRSSIRRRGSSSRRRSSTANRRSALRKRSGSVASSSPLTGDYYRTSSARSSRRSTASRPCNHEPLPVLDPGYTDVPYRASRRLSRRQSSSTSRIQRQ